LTGPTGIAGPTGPTGISATVYPITGTGSTTNPVQIAPTGPCGGTVAWESVAKAWNIYQFPS